MLHAVQIRKDLEMSIQAYADVWDKKLSELGLTEISAKASWERIRARIGY